MLLEVLRGERLSPLGSRLRKSGGMIGVFRVEAGRRETEWGIGSIMDAVEDDTADADADVGHGVSPL